MTTQRIYLQVPYAKKEEAKKFGARWDAQNKKWYYQGSELPHGLEKFLLENIRAAHAAQEAKEKAELEKWRADTKALLEEADALEADGKFEEALEVILSAKYDGISYEGLEYIRFKNTDISRLKEKIKDADAYEARMAECEKRQQKAKEDAKAVEAEQKAKAKKAAELRVAVELKEDMDNYPVIEAAANDDNAITWLAAHVVWGQDDPTVDLIQDQLDMAEYFSISNELKATLETLRKLRYKARIHSSNRNEATPKYQALLAKFIESVELERFQK